MPDYGHEQTDKELKKLEAKLTKEYSQAAKEVEKKAKKYLEQFAKKDEEMRKKVAAGEMSAEEYGKWRIGQMAMGERWKEMQKTLAEDLVNVDKIAAGMINNSLPSAYALNYNYGTYEVEHGVEINTSFTLYDHSTVENLMKDDPKIIPKAKVDIPKDELWNRRKLTSAITQGILQGESIPKIASRLASVADMDRKAAIRNARTYTTAAENKGRIDSYDRAEEMGIKVQKKWMATLDDRTRVEHRHLDGMVVPNDEVFEVDGYEIMYPGDPDAEPEMIYNCRCTLVADIEGHKYNDERNDSKLGDMTYEEWKHAKDRTPVELPKEEKSITKPEIPENVRKEIDRFEEKFRNANKENYMAIDKDGNVIFESSGKERKVTVPKYVDEKMEGGYSIHNHPVDATFSVADISNYEKYGENGIITDINGYESILYNTNPVAKFREVQNAEGEEYAKLMPFSVDVYKAFSEIDDDVTERRREYSKELMQMEPDSVQRAKMLNEWMKENDPEIRKREWLEENAEKYGFIYIRRKIGD